MGIVLWEAVREEVPDLFEVKGLPLRGPYLAQLSSALAAGHRLTLGSGETTSLVGWPLWLPELQGRCLAESANLRPTFSELEAAFADYSSLSPEEKVVRTCEFFPMHKD
jgi:hypothetical protein